MVAAVPLSEEDLAAARAELAAGKPFTVWFTSAAVGVPADGSAKVISIGDAGEGDFIQVRPAGSRDTVFCSPNEVTRTRPVRKRVPRAAGPIGPARSIPPPPVSPPPGPEPASASGPARGPGRPRQVSSRRGTGPAEVTITLNATPEGEWSVEVVIGTKRTVRPTPVQPADVAAAARSLPPAVARAIESSLEAARRRQLERVERLRAELDAAQRALHELSTSAPPPSP